MFNRIMNNIKIKFGNRVKGLRNNLGISQEKMASLADLDRTYIADIEGGKRNVSLVVIHQIAVVFEISISELLEGIDSDLTIGDHNG